ncbi:hypothetical protein [Aquamicrobium defluvii]|uniref:Uncharacterized protein n=1 Tax=Aquamicrobium defluvii TaxID=69279 RepID=A0A4V3DKQ9_9HYPH|nr:hypothetical protein [Aquamicrobium defluvii]TDR35717.1 hypothetical protein DES43_108142 [Aquamicrobium defluvii]
MNRLTVHVEVPDLAGGEGARRVAGVLDDLETICVALKAGGEEQAVSEFSFSIGEAAALSRACLSGDRRALTTPGLARILSASVAVLFRVAHHAGAFRHGDLDERDAGHDDDRQQAGRDEDPGD